MHFRNLDCDEAKNGLQSKVDLLFIGKPCDTLTIWILKNDFHIDLV